MQIKRYFLEILYIEYFISSNISAFVVIEPVDTFAGGSGSVSAGLKFHSGNKNNKKKVHVDSVYSYGLSFKKPKRLEASGTIVDSLAGPLFTEILQATNIRHNKSWNSKIKSKKNSVSGILDVKNLKNTVTEKMSYVDSNTSKMDDMMNNATLKKMQTKTYVLEQLPKVFSFVNISDDTNELVLPVPKFVGSNQLLFTKLCPVKSFILDVELSTVPEKTIRKVKELTIHKNIVVNDDVRQINKYLNWKVIVKKIPVDFLRLAVVVVFSKFGEIALNEFRSVKIANLISKDMYCALLYTFLVGTSVHDLSKLVAFYGEKTCAIICFENKTSKLAVIGSVLVFKSMSLYWAGFSLAYCTRCKQFGHIIVNCLVGGNSVGRKRWVVSTQDWVCLATQVAGRFSFHITPLVTSGFGVLSKEKFSSMDFFLLVLAELNDYLASLECFLKLLTDQISGIMKKLSFVELVPLATLSYVFSVAASAAVKEDLNSDMALDGALLPSISSLPVVDDLVTGLGLSSLKMLIFKVSGLESKMVGLEVLIKFVLDRLDGLCSSSGLPASPLLLLNDRKILFDGMKNLGIQDKFDGVRVFTGLDVGFAGAGIAIIINDSLACHIVKVVEISGRIILVHFLFKDKLLVIVIGLYAGVFSAVNSIIANAVNSNTFVVLGGDFNKDGLGTEKILDYIFVNENLLSVIADYGISSVSAFFNTDHKTIMVLIRLGGLLDIYLNSLHKQANKDYWKFKIKDANNAKWLHFKKCFFAKFSAVALEFSGTQAYANVNGMWVLLKRLIVESANEIFSRHWFNKFQCSRNKLSSKFFGLELLVAKIVKKLGLNNMWEVNWLISIWSKLDSIKAAIIANMIWNRLRSLDVLRWLLLFYKEYRKSKIYKSRLAEEILVWATIKKHMEKFCFDKGGIIKSVLDCLFCKVVLDYLVVDDELVLEPEKQININNIQKKRPKTSATTNSKFNIQNGIEIFKKSLYQYIENCINNYLFKNYNISEIRNNFYNNLVHYSQLGTENLNSKTLATYFQKLNFNIIEYCEKKYPVQPKYSFDFESETKTSNKSKQKVKQYLRMTPNTPILPKTTAKHLQTPEQETKNLESKETKSEQEETTENKEKMATAYIAKIPEFTGENNNTSS
ncbi:hypothetical protein G9A89_023304 [Geosiphon pyriformis]|nr:hypothetical protein G9A89_023304 [Geosiphon pyriformis]